MGKPVEVEFIGRDKSLSSTIDGASDKSNKLGGHLKSLGKIMAVGLAGGAVAAGAALVGMTKNAVEDAAGARRLAVALKNTAGATDAQVASVEDWISAQGKALGVTDDELRPAFQRLVQATGDIGKAQDLASIAMDASAGSGKSLKQVTESIAKAQNGNLGALSRLGIAIKDNEGKTLSFDQVMKNMSTTFKGQATASADTLDGKMSRLKLMFDETKESIGYKLIPILTTMATVFLNDVVPALSQAGSWLQEHLGPAFQRIGQVIGSIFGSGGQANADVSSGFASIRSIVESVVSIITTLWRTFGDFYVTYARSTLQNLVTVIGGLLNVIAGVFKVFSSLLKGDWSGVWEGIKQILRGALAVLQGVLSQALAAIRLLWSVAWTAIKAVLSGIWSGITGLVDAGVAAVVGAIKAIPGKISALAGKFKDAGGDVIQGLMNGLKNAGGFASGIADGVWNAVKGVINSAIDRLNSLLDFSISVGPKTFHVSAPNIGHLANGGRRVSDGLTWVGERGPELMSLPGGTRIVPNGVARNMDGGGAGVHVTISGPVYGDPRAFAQWIVTQLLAERRIAGPLGLG